jgi:hypothetical protein
MKAVSWLAQRDFESTFCAQTVARPLPVPGWLISAHDSALPKKNKKTVLPITMFEVVRMID